MQLQTSLPEKAECVCETLVLYLTKLFFTGWKQKPKYMPPVPCVHLNVHIVNIKEVLCGSGIGVTLSRTYVEFTRKRGDCDDIRTFTKGIRHLWFSASGQGVKHVVTTLCTRKQLVMYYMDRARFVYPLLFYLSSVLWYAPAPTREPWKETASTECLQGIEKRVCMCMSFKLGS